MGWHNIKKHYRIAHILRVTKDGISIMSGYLPDIIVIDRDGKVRKRYDGSNVDLLRYQAEMDADPELLASLVKADDQFSQSIPVYTYDGGQVLEKRCEEPGWPNATHDGELMYENMYSTDKTKVVQFAKSNAAASARLTRDRIADVEEQLANLRVRMAQFEADRFQLDEAYPDVVVEAEA